MPTDKRQRHKQGRAARREAAIAEMRRRQRRRRLIQVGGILLVVLLVGGLVSALAGGDDDSADVATQDESTTTTAASVPDLEPPTCATGDGAAVDTSTKPTVAPKEGEPPTELQCTDIVVGDGEVAEAGDTAEMRYVGVKWSNGEEFDASWNRNETFPVSPLGSASVIAGWNEGILGMKVGGRRELVIPPSKGYGASPGHELQNETLVFVVDLVSLEKA